MHSTPDISLAEKVLNFPILACEDIYQLQWYAQYYSRAVSPYGIFIVCTDRPVLAAWQQYRPIVPVSSAETASYKPRRV